MAKRSTAMSWKMLIENNEIRESAISGNSNSCLKLYLILYLILDFIIKSIKEQKHYCINMN